MYGNIRLTLTTANNSFVWASVVPIPNTIASWEIADIPAGEFPWTLSTDSVQFSLETIGDPSLFSFVSVDEISLYFCLPCDYSSITAGMNAL